MVKGAAAVTQYNLSLKNSFISLSGNVKRLKLPLSFFQWSSVCIICHLLFMIPTLSSDVLSKESSLFTLFILPCVSLNCLTVERCGTNKPPFCPFSWLSTRLESVKLLTFNLQQDSAWGKRNINQLQHSNTLDWYRHQNWHLLGRSGGPYWKQFSQSMPESI